MPISIRLFQLSLTIVLPLPSKALSPNARVHWRTLAAKKKLAKRDGWLACVAAMNAAGVMGGWTAASVKATFYWPTKTRRDPDNAMASLKAYQDGFVRAGLLVDDDNTMPLPPSMLLDRENPRVELFVEQD